MTGPIGKGQIMQYYEQMQSRRKFLGALTAFVGATAFGAIGLGAGDQAQAAQRTSFVGQDIFRRIMRKAGEGGWSRLPMGELMGKIAMEFVGTPYKGNTLELSAKEEICAINLTGLDCVTFFETTLAFARMLKKGGRTPQNLLREIAFTRYRGGKPGDYTSRLHYTSDWLFDNQAKHVVEILSDLPGAVPFTQKVGFMSSHPHSYRQLDANANFVGAIAQQEAAINSRSLKYVPLADLPRVEPLLQTGDIVGVCTSIAGLDISHTGLIICTPDGVRHFMDASSKTGKVTLEPGPISQALNWSKNLTGAMFARPLAVSG